MSVVLVGLNHKTAPVDIRERLSYSPDDLSPILQQLRERDGVAECAVLSTCNRTEIYAAPSNTSACLHSLTEFLGIQDHLYRHADGDAVRHLFSVSSGLDSLVLGENQILAQVRQAYVVAQEAETTGPILDKLFPWALRVGKRARSQTKICQGASSVAAAAIELAQMIFGDLKGRKVLLLGAGKMSQAALGLLSNAGVERIKVVNRTLQRAEELAQRCGGEAVPFEELDSGLQEIDVLMASTGAPHYIVNRERLRRVMRARRGKPLFIVDIAVPRDIDPDCQDIDNVYLYNIDDLQQVVAENLARRHSEVQKVLEIVHLEAEEYSRYLDSRRANDAIRSLRSRFEGLRDRELERFLEKYGVEAQEAERLKLFSNTLLNKLLHSPTVRLRQLGSGGVESDDLAKALEILGLGDPEP